MGSGSTFPRQSGGDRVVTQEARPGPQWMRVQGSRGTGQANPSRQDPESRCRKPADAPLPRNNGAGREARLPVPETDTGGLG